MYGLLMGRSSFVLLPGAACLTHFSHLADTDQRWAKWRGRAHMGRLPQSRNRLGFIIPSLGVHSNQMQIAAHTFHKQYGFKQSSA
jgi:hypothetical protein